MITAIPNQPINFGEPLVSTRCDEREIPLEVSEADELVFQFMQDKCGNATQLIPSPDFREGWLTGGVWNTTRGACAENGQAGAAIQNDDWTPTVGELYQVEFTITSIGGSGITVSVGGYTQTVTAPGTHSFTFAASDTSPLAFELIDDTSSVCIDTAEVYGGNDGLTITVESVNEGECEELWSVNIQDEPQYFTLTGQHVTVIIPVEDIELEGARCFRICIAEGCSYLYQPVKLCSQTIKLTDECKGTLSMRVCNDSDQMGFVAGRFNFRLRASLVKPRWEYDMEEERWSNGYINRHFIDRQRVMDLMVQSVDGALHPFLSAVTMFDHFYIGEQEYSVDAENYEPEYGDALMSNGGIVLAVRPKQELLRKVLCVPVGEGCNPANDPICNTPNVTITQDGNYIDVVLYSLVGFIPDRLNVIVNGSPTDSIPFSTPQSQHLGPFSPGDSVVLEITNLDQPECPYTHPELIVPCSGPGIGRITLSEADSTNIMFGSWSGYVTLRDSDGNVSTQAADGSTPATLEAGTYCFWGSDEEGVFDPDALAVIVAGSANAITDIDVNELNALMTLDLQQFFAGTSLDVSGLATPFNTVLEYVTVQDSAGFTTVSLPDTHALLGVNFYATALTEEIVNAILANLVANNFTGSCQLDGGTSAAPTGQGITDKATLIGNGATVTTN